MNQAAAGRTGTRFQEEFADVVGNLGLVQESIGAYPSFLLNFSAAAFKCSNNSIS